MHGRLGAIVYGDSAVNRVRMEGRASLFAEFRRYSPEWAVVEHNTADLTAPQRPATYAQAYRSLRDIANYGARLIAPMAWNGSPGETAGTAEFRNYTSLRRAPLEEAIAHFMLARADLPRRARLWTFGTTAHADDDGWQVHDRPATPNHAGALTLQLDSQGNITLVSPGELACDANTYDAIVIQAQAPEQALAFEAQGQADDGSWITLCPETPWHRFEQSAAGAWCSITHTDSAVTLSRLQFDRIRLTWHGQPGMALTVKSIALYPRSPHRVEGM
jgi:hypothetical protein